jgi:hypothetical protein
MVGAFVLGQRIRSSRIQKLLLEDDHAQEEERQ